MTDWLMRVSNTVHERCRLLLHNKTQPRNCIYSTHQLKRAVCIKH